MELASAVPETVKFLVGRLAPFTGDVITGEFGVDVSMTMFLMAPIEPDAPGVASVRVAVFPAASVIDPLPTDRLVVLT